VFFTELRKVLYFTDYVAYGKRRETCS